MQKFTEEKSPSFCQYSQENRVISLKKAGHFDFKIDLFIE
jgi:hypothetical protein